MAGHGRSPQRFVVTPTWADREAEAVPSGLHQWKTMDDRSITQLKVESGEKSRAMISSDNPCSSICGDEWIPSSVVIFSFDRCNAKICQNIWRWPIQLFADHYINRYQADKYGFIGIQFE